MASGWVGQPEERALPRVRDGFYLRFGSGLGYMASRGTGPTGTASLSGLGSLSAVSIGGSVARGLVLAGTVRAASGSATFQGGPLSGATITASNGMSVPASQKAGIGLSEIGLLIDWYPKPTAGWHAAASVGLSAAMLTNLATDSTFSGVGIGGSLSGGYDWAIASDWSFGVEVVALGSSSASMKRDDNGDTGYRLRGFSLGLQGSILYF